VKATILVGDVRTRLAEIPDGSVQTCVTSPPYWGLRDYGHDGQIGLEQTPDAYVAELVEVFRGVRRVLTEDGTLWLNLGDSYAGNSGGTQGASGSRASRAFTGTMLGGKGGNGIKPKDLVGIPWRVAFALQGDGWWLRQDIIWAKPNPMPESITDRCTKAHEYLFLLSKSARYYYDLEPIREDVKPGSGSMATQAWDGYRGDKISDPRSLRVERTYDVIKGANRRSVWNIATKPFAGAHFAVMPEALVEPCILAGSRAGDTVLDPFAGSGTVGVVALKHGRNFIGTELNPEYAALAEARIHDDGPLFNEVETVA
jgi:DNA modification methylase